jgi:hypothetical protein
MIESITWLMTIDFQVSGIIVISSTLNGSRAELAGQGWQEVVG